MLAEKKMYFVAFDSQGGSNVATIRGVVAGATIQMPQQPTRIGYTFLGWYTEPNGEGAIFMDRTKITDAMTVYAYWKPDAEIPKGLWLKEVSNQTYSGTAIKPTVFVYDSNNALLKGTDYTVAYTNNIKAADSTAPKAPTITVTGKGKYQKLDTKTFTILPKSIISTDISVNINDQAYTGKPVFSVPTVTWGKKVLKKGTDYTLTYQKDTVSLGTVNVIIEGCGNYMGTRTVQYRITNQLINKATIAKIEKQSYRGKYIEPELMVSYGTGSNKVILQPYNKQTGEGDYSVYYENNLNVGTAKVTVTGIGIYGGTKSATFAIGKRLLQNDEIVVDPIVQQLYKGEGIKPLPVVKDGNNILKDGIDYTVGYSNNTKVAGADAKKHPNCYNNRQG